MSLFKIGMYVALSSIVVVAAASRGAVAAPGVAIAIESYEGDRPADAAALLAPVYTELAKRGFVTRDPLVSAVDADLSRAAGQLSASDSAAAQKLVEQGYDHFINGDYSKALDAEKPALTLYAAAPATLAKEPSLRDRELKALLVAARSSEVLGHGEDAFRYMAEAIRTIPDRPLNAGEFDPQVKALYKRVKDELTRQGAGTLEVKVDDSTAVIFVDERFAGTGAVKLDGLLPGRYRIYVAKGEQAGRVREVDLPAKGHASVDVPWQIDGALRTRAGYVGLESPRGSGTEGQLDAAVKLGRALGATRVVVLGIRAVEDRRSIVAYAINTESQNKIYGAVQVEPISPPPATLEKLADLLAGDKIDAAGIITKEPAPVHSRRVIGTRPSALHRLKWVFGAGALIALGTGGGLVALDDKPSSGTSRLADYRNTGNLGVGLAAGGTALAAVAIYMFTADHPVDIEAEDVPSRVSLTPAIAPDSVGFALSGRF